VVPRLEYPDDPFSNMRGRGAGGAGGAGRGRGAAGAGANAAPAGANEEDPAAAPARRGGGGGGVFTYPPGVVVPPPQYTPYTSNRTTVTPPYSSVTCYDLNTGTIKWQIPFGEAVGIAPAGNNYGMDLYHGPKARLGITAGGLALVATPEAKARAYDKDTGKVLWETKIPARAQGAPAIYEVDGREYVAFTLVGSYIAFALPAKP
jgi:quinoprotein glucose dehydrogenase